MGDRSYRFFVDSADVSLWKRFRAEGWLYGATTNPRILDRAKLPVTLETAKQLADSASIANLDELQVQSWGAETGMLVENGMALANLWDGIVIKIPATIAGIAAARALKDAGKRVTLTACYTAHQAAAAATMELDYVAPYYGRMLEAGIDADNRLSVMRGICSRVEGMRVLVASIRSHAQIELLLSAGFDTFTFAPDLCAHMVDNAMSDRDAADFEEAAKNSRH